MLTQWFEPEPAFKGLLFAKELKKKGHDVCVLTGFPNYPSGKLYPGYKLSLYKKEEMDGIQIIRVPLFPSHDRNPIKRSLNYISFALSAALIGVFLVPKSDVAYVYHPPATVGFSAWILRCFRRISFVYDIQDIWPDTVMQSGMLKVPFVEKALGGFCKWIYKQASHLVVLSDGFKKTLESRGVSSEKISVIPNWCDEESLMPMPFNTDLAKQYGMFGKFNIVFAGGMGTAQGLDTVLDAAKLLRDQSDIQFVMIGEGTELCRLKLIVSQQQLNNVMFIPRQPMNEIGKFLNIADTLLVHLKDDPLFKITIPSKTQAYMRIGKPILMGVQGDAADIIKRSNAGICFTPEDPKSLADAVLQVYNMDQSDRKKMGKNGSREYENVMSFTKGIDRITAILSENSRFPQ